MAAGQSLVNLYVIPACAPILGAHAIDSRSCNLSKRPGHTRI